MISNKKVQGFADARLDTWKLVAQYLGRSTRTVQRWRLEYGLPVRQLGGDATSVFAYTDELDEWMRNRNPSNSKDSALWHEPSSSNEASFPASLLIAQPLRTTVLHGTGSSESCARELVSLAEKMWECLSDSNISSIVRLYRQATDSDPYNSKAFAGLSQALIAAGVLGTLHSLDAYPSAEAAMMRASELDSELIEARCATAWLKLLVVRDWMGAEITFDEVLLERPSCTQAIVGRAVLAIAEGQLIHAAELLRKAAAHRPLNSSATALLCWREYLAGNFENALAFVSQARATGHAGRILDAVEALAGVLLQGSAANIERLSHQMKDSPPHFAQLGVLGYMYGSAGQTEKARAIINSLTVVGISGKCDYAYPMALTYLGLNEHIAAMEWLEKSYLQGSLWCLGFQLDPILAPLRRDPRFRTSFANMRSDPARVA